MMRAATAHARKRERGARRRTTARRPCSRGYPCGPVRRCCMQASSDRRSSSLRAARTQGSAELHRRWGRVGGSAAGHAVDTCCTVQLARGARLELLERLRRRGHERVFGVEGAPAGWTPCSAKPWIASALVLDPSIISSGPAASDGTDPRSHWSGGRRAHTTAIGRHTLECPAGLTGAIGSTGVGWRRRHWMVGAR